MERCGIEECGQNLKSLQINRVLYCTYFFDETQKLYFFFSDFPHLVKCLWAWIVNKIIIEVIKQQSVFSTALDFFFIMIVYLFIFFYVLAQEIKNGEMQPTSPKSRDQKEYWLIYVTHNFFHVIILL